MCRLCASVSPQSAEHCVGTVIVATSARSLASLVGKDASFTARRDVWGFVVDAVRHRPLTGYGFASFWDDPDNIANQYDRIGRLGCVRPQHVRRNAALPRLNRIGPTDRRGCVQRRQGLVGQRSATASPAMAWWTATAMFAFAENLAESMILFHSIFWVLLVAPGFAALRNTIGGVTQPRRTVNTRRRSPEPSGRSGSSRPSSSAPHPPG